MIIDPALGLDGITGQPRWTGQKSISLSPQQFKPKMLDRGETTAACGSNCQRPGRNFVCRAWHCLRLREGGSRRSSWRPHVPPGLAQATTRGGRGAASHRLIWLTGMLGPLGFLVAVCGLAMVNVVLPLLILLPWTRAWHESPSGPLMALPVAAALPLMVFLMLERVLPVGSNALLSSEKRLFVTGTVAGCYQWPWPRLPLTVAAWPCVRRWRPPAALGGLTILASLAIAVVWVWFDMKSMASIERYGWRGWHLVALPGVYAASALLLIGWAILSLFRVMKRSRPTPP